MTLDPKVTTISGPATLVAEVDHVEAPLDISDARDTVSSTVTLQALDKAGDVLSGLTIDPPQVDLQQAIGQAGGYREVAVKVDTVGQVASGFRVTSISVNPPVVTLFSTDNQIVAGLPGYVATQPLNLTGAEGDLVTRLALDLPQGVIVVGEQQNVEVSVGVVAIETSTQLNIQVELTGLASGLQAELSPLTATVIVSGPASTLEALQAGDIRLLVDLSGLQAGTHLLEPKAEILPEDVQAVSISPAQIQVVISTAP